VTLDGRTQAGPVAAEPKGVFANRQGGMGQVRGFVALVVMVLTASCGSVSSSTGTGGSGGASGTAGASGRGGAAGGTAGSAGGAGSTGSAGSGGAAGTVSSGGFGGSGGSGGGAGSVSSGGSGGSAGSTGHGGSDGTAGAGGRGGSSAGAGGSAGGSGGSAGSGGGSAGSSNAGTSGAAGASGTGGTAGTGGGAQGGQSGNAGATGKGGGAGTAPCVLQFLASDSEVSAAYQGRTVVQTDFGHFADGSPATYQVVTGDAFLMHDLVTFQSVDTSDQSPVGTVNDYVIAFPPSSIQSSSTAATSYSGYDGIRSNFSTARTVVAATISVGPNQVADSFDVVVRRTDTPDATIFNLAAGKTVAGVQSSCPSIIKSIDILPRAVQGGAHMSINWFLTGLSFAN